MNDDHGGAYRDLLGLFLGLWALWALVRRMLWL